MRLCSTLSSTVACSSTPGTTAANGVGTSSNPAAVNPTSAMRPASRSLGTRPAMTSAALTCGMVPGGPEEVDPELSGAVDGHLASAEMDGSDTARAYRDVRPAPATCHPEGLEGERRQEAITHRQR